MDTRGFGSIIVAVVMALLTLGAVGMIVNERSRVTILPQSSRTEVYATSSPSPTMLPAPAQITTFEECEDGGYAVAESHPRQCFGPEGKKFIEDIIGSPSPSPQVVMKTIPTKAGELTLTFSEGVAVLSGTLFRENPCVGWHISVWASDDTPPSSIEFSIDKRSTAEICIQVIGKPQTVRAESPAREKTHYRIFLEQEQVFSGFL